ncbi:MAG: peptidoglycan DD-metalloendopeptidase family protein [Boseongicola sp.]|nr:peptidoglycan DD-metalloendopeptidase family protein [Boseongicola sp.]
MMFRALIFALLFAAPATAQDRAAELANSASQALAEASGELEAAETAKDRIAALTNTVSAYEDGLTALRAGLRQISLEERALSLDLNAQQSKVSELLAVLQSIERAQRSTGALHPDGVLPAIRAGILSAEMVPALNARASALTGELEEAVALIALRRASEAQLKKGLDDILEARLALSQAISERTDLPEPVATDPAVISALINGSETLSAFADSLSGESPWVDPGQEQWPLPLRGRIVRFFDEPDENGIKRPGWVLAAESAALVTSPTSATVRFTGQLETEGGVIILEPREGEMLILAGVNEVFVRRGQVVKAGDALALMGGNTPAAQEILIETAEGSGLSSAETLYIEVRHDRKAIDPGTRFDPDAR